MPPNQKIFIHKKVYELCFRTEEGLPFVAAPYIRVLWESILGRAQSMYPVKLIGAVLMANHAHMIIRTEDPEDVPNFVAYLKKESAHAVNRLLGRHQHTVWQEGYDSPLLGDPEKVIERLVYCYTNPQKANLVDTIEDYPRWSTWAELEHGGGKKNVSRIPRNEIPALPRRALSFQEQAQLAEELADAHAKEFNIVVEPDAWVESFPELRNANRRELREMVVERVQAKEASFRKDRKKPVIGAANLRLESMSKFHTPKKRGKKMLCMFSDKELRSGYISWFRDMVKELHDLIAKAGTHFVQRPPGFFRPGGGVCSHLNPLFTPVG